MTLFKLQAAPIVLVAIAAVLFGTEAARGAALVPVRIQTKPEGAQVYLDGVLRGETPASLRLPEGEHDLFIYQKGMLPIVRRVNWRPGDRPIIRETLRRQNGGLVVFSDPVGADVTLDGRPLGKAPLAYENIAPGTYRVEVRRDGFEPFSQDVSIDDTDANEVVARLAGAPVGVFIEAPVGAKVYIDGSYAGEVTSGTLSLRIRAGSHELRIEQGGFASIQTVMLEPGRDAFLVPGEMQRIPGAAAFETAKLNPRWYIVVGTGAAAVGGGVFATLSAVRAHAARADYEEAFLKRDIVSAKDRIRSNNRNLLIGAGVFAAGAAGVWLAWPATARVSVAGGVDRVALRVEF